MLNNIRVKKGEKFIFQHNLQCLCIKCCILAAVYLFIANHLCS